MYIPFFDLMYDPETNLTTTMRSYDLWNFRADSYAYDTINITFARYLGYIPQRNFNLSTDANHTDSQFGIAVHLRTLTCRGYSTVYRVNITNRDSVQNLTYTVHGKSVLNNQGTSFTWTNQNNNLDPNKTDDDYLKSILPRNSTGYKEWARYHVPEYLRSVNALNLFEYATRSIAGYHGTWIDLDVTRGVQCIEKVWVENGTRVDLCAFDASDGMGETSTPSSRKCFFSFPPNAKRKKKGVLYLNQPNVNFLT